MGKSKIEANNVWDDSVFDNKYDALSARMRKAAGYNAYGTQTVFEAIVLTDPFPLDPAQAALFFESKTAKAEGGLFERLTELWEGQGQPPSSPQRISKFIFKARIDGVNSPHAFIPDPCSETYAKKPEKAKELTACHTTFISTEDYISGKGSSIPKAGDLVKVRLKKNYFSYNLVLGEFLQVIDKRNLRITIGGDQVECTDISNMFEKGYPSTIQSLRDEGSPSTIQSLEGDYVEAALAAAIPAAAAAETPETDDDISPRDEDSDDPE